MKTEIIGIGIIGTGFARTTQLPAFRAGEGARGVAIASGHRENAERVARECDIPVVASDWREVVAREDVDLVCIATPPFTHAEIATAALDAGKSVLCEKPMAMNAEETDLPASSAAIAIRSEEHTAELHSHLNLVCRLLLQKKKRATNTYGQSHC